MMQLFSQTKSLIFFIFFSLLFQQSIYSQAEVNNWYFGNNAGITFNTSPPSALTNGALHTFEGCATISDSTGNLLFYTDGINVWDRTHNLMPNGFGLMGHPSAAQSGIIIPKPGSTTMYIIITVHAQENIGAGMRYSEVDMTLNGGLGDVVTATKNTLMYSSSSEKVTAVKHSNGFYYWIVGREIASNRYAAFLLDCSGINPFPVNSFVGTTNGEYWGYLVASPDGSRLAGASRVSGIELVDFNTTTGVVSNPVFLGNLNYASSPGGCYGVAFSPNNNVLYATSIENWALVQWDLTAPSIPASEFFVGYTNGSSLFRPSYRGGALQLAPDGKIYLPDYNLPSLSVIANPNVVGPGCNFSYAAVNLMGRNSQLGLPPFVQSFFSPPVQNVQHTSPLCLGDTTFFSINGSSALDSVLWNFGDTTSSSTTSTALNPIHVFSDTGTYLVSVVRFIACISDTVNVLVHQPPTVSAGSSYTSILCYGDSSLASVNIVGGNSGYHYSWSHNAGLNNDTATGLIAGNYTVTITDNNNCSTTQSFTITQPTPLQDSVSFTTSNCGLSDGSATIFTSGGTSGYGYTWSHDTLITTSSATNIPAGPVQVIITDANNCADTVSFVITNSNGPVPYTSILNDVLCKGGNSGSAVVDSVSGTGAFSYEWYDNTFTSTGQTGSTATNLPAGTYYVEVTDGNNCTTIDTLIITEPLTNVSVSIDSSSSPLCNGVNNGTALAVGVGGTGSLSYSWNTTPVQTGNTAINLGAGTYVITATDSNGCISRDTVILTSPSALQLITDVTGVLCNGDSTGSATVQVSGGTPGYTYTWLNTVDTDSVLSSQPAGNYTIRVTDNNGCTDSSVVVITEPTAINLIISDSTTATCGLNDGMIDISASGGVPTYTYNWSNGSTTEDLLNIPSGSYSLLLTDSNGCTRNLSVDLSCETPFVIPQVITPNGDGSNDTWYIDGLDAYPNAKVEIFNRWGNLVYSADPYQNNWDGRSNNGSLGNDVLPDATYFFILTLDKNTEPIVKYLELQK